MPYPLGHWGLPWVTANPFFFFQKSSVLLLYMVRVAKSLFLFSLANLLQNCKRFELQSQKNEFSEREKPSGSSPHLFSTSRRCTFSLSVLVHNLKNAVSVTERQLIQAPLRKEPWVSLGAYCLVVKFSDRRVQVQITFSIKKGKNQEKACSRWGSNSQPRHCSTDTAI